MTWCKLGVEFFDQCADMGLSDAAVRTHVEALHYLYRAESDEMRIGKHLVRRFAGSDQWEIAVKDLAAAGFWRDDGDAWVVEHHGDVFRSSLAAQLKHRENERDRQRRKRRGDNKPPADLPELVGTNTDANVGTNVRATQTDRQTDSAVEDERNAKCRQCQQPTDEYVLKNRDGYCITCNQARSA